eukprot:symbB.v1.2.036539.t1/scaffold5185.1/size43247/2
MANHIDQDVLRSRAEDGQGTGHQELAEELDPLLSLEAFNDFGLGVQLVHSSYWAQEIRENSNASALQSLDSFINSEEASKTAWGHLSQNGSFALILQPRNPQERPLAVSLLLNMSGRKHSGPKVAKAILRAINERASERVWSKGLNFEWPVHSFDIFSLGVLGLNLFLGQSGTKEVMLQVSRQVSWVEVATRWNKTIPEAVTRLLEMMLHSSAKLRPSPLEVLDALIRVYPKKHPGQRRRETMYQVKVEKPPSPAILSPCLPSVDLTPPPKEIPLEVETPPPPFKSLSGAEAALQQMASQVTFSSHILVHFRFRALNNAMTVVVVRSLNGDDILGPVEMESGSFGLRALKLQMRSLPFWSEGDLSLMNAEGEVLTADSRHLSGGSWTHPLVLTAIRTERSFYGVPWGAICERPESSSALQQLTCCSVLSWRIGWPL